jgi:hypothetical protein
MCPLKHPLPAQVRGTLLPFRAEERLAITAAQQEDEAGQVVAQLPGAVGAAAGEALKRGLEVILVAGEPGR